MKVLVIGGNRFFGKRLVNLLGDAGHDVTVANRGNIPNSFSSNVKVVKLDRADEATMNAAFGKMHFDVVYDQACYNAEQADIAKRVFTGKIGRMIFTSTVSVYDPRPALREDDFDPIKFREGDRADNDYQYGKRLAEKSYAEATFPVAALRIMRSDQVAEFLFWLLSKPTIVGPINAASPDPVRLSEFMTMVEQHCRKKAAYATEAMDENHSPYGVSEDFYISVERAVVEGYRFAKTDAWFPALVKDLCDELS